MVDQAVIDAHRYASRHRREIENSRICGCFGCMQIYPPSDITRWIDNGDTALCPKCGIDSVIGLASGYPITVEFLKRMNVYWFGVASAQLSAAADFVEWAKTHGEPATIPMTYGEPMDEPVIGPDGFSIQIRRTSLPDYNIADQFGVNLTINGAVYTATVEVTAVDDEWVTLASKTDLT